MPKLSCVSVCRCQPFCSLSQGVEALKAGVDRNGHRRVGRRGVARAGAVGRGGVGGQYRGFVWGAAVPEKLCHVLGEPQQLSHVAVVQLGVLIDVLFMCGVMW